jgi:hypothetical protein
VIDEYGATRPVPNDSFPYAVLVEPGGKRAFVSLWAKAAVAVLDLDEAAALVGGDAGDLEALATALATRVRRELGAGAGMTALARIDAAADPATGRHQGSLVLATDLDGRAATRRHEFGSTRADLRRRAILWGAEFLRLELLREGEPAGVDA